MIIDLMNTDKSRNAQRKEGRKGKKAPTLHSKIQSLLTAQYIRLLYCFCAESRLLLGKKHLQCFDNSYYPLSLPAIT